MQLEKTVAATEELAAANKKIIALQQELREVKRAVGGEAQVLVLQIWELFTDYIALSEYLGAVSHCFCLCQLVHSGSIAAFGTHRL